MTYLLLVPDQVVEEERRFGLVAAWIHPCQAHLPSLDEAVRKVTLLINTGEDWTYAFTQLIEDSQHIPLSTARHISAMIDGASSRSTCGHRSHLEVCKPLQCGVEMVYPEGLNGDWNHCGSPSPNCQSGTQIPMQDLPMNPCSCG